MIFERFFRKKKEPLDLISDESLFFRKAVRLFEKSTTLNDLSEDVREMKAIMGRLIQDLVVFREMLQEKGLWEDERYKALRIKRMINDHNSAGASPWLWHSYYSYLLTEKEFLRQVLKAEDSEVRDFEVEIKRVQTLT